MDNHTDANGENTGITNVNRLRKDLICYTAKIVETQKRDRNKLVRL